MKSKSIYRDLADINKDGHLTRDGFAIAMHLIHGKLAGKEVPKSLPPSLIASFMRSNGTSPSFMSVSKLQDSVGVSCEVDSRHWKIL